MSIRFSLYKHIRGFLFDYRIGVHISWWKVGTRGQKEFQYDVYKHELGLMLELPIKIYAR